MAAPTRRIYAAQVIANGKGETMQHPTLAIVRDDIELRGYSERTLTAYLRNCANYRYGIGQRWSQADFVH